MQSTDPIEQFRGEKDGEEKVVKKPDPSLHNIAMVPALKEIWFPVVLSVDKVTIFAKQTEKNEWNLSLIKRHPAFPDRLILTEQEMRMLCSLPDNHPHKVKDVKHLVYTRKPVKFRTPFVFMVFPFDTKRFGNWTNEDPATSNNSKQAKTKAADLGKARWVITVDCRRWKPDLEVVSQTEPDVPNPRKSPEQYRHASEFADVTEVLHANLIRSVFKEAQENIVDGSRLESVTPFRIIVTKAKKQVQRTGEDPLECHCRVTADRLPVRAVEFNDKFHQAGVWTYHGEDDEGKQHKYVKGDRQIKFSRRCFKRAFERHEDEKSVMKEEPRYQETKRAALLEERLKEYIETLPKDWSQDIMERVLALYVSGAPTQSSGTQYLRYDPFEVVDFATRKSLPMSTLRSGCVASIEATAEYYIASVEKEPNAYQGIRYVINRAVVYRAAPKWTREQAAEALIPVSNDYEYDFTDAVSAVQDDGPASVDVQAGQQQQPLQQQHQMAVAQNYQPQQQSQMQQAPATWSHHQGKIDDQKQPFAYTQSQAVQDERMRTLMAAQLAMSRATPHGQVHQQSQLPQLQSQQQQPPPLKKQRGQATIPSLLTLAQAKAMYGPGAGQPQAPEPNPEDLYDQAGADAEHDL